MFLWTLKITFISILLIFLIHNILCFFTFNLTKPHDASIVETKLENYKMLLNKMTHELSEKDKQLANLQKEPADVEIDVDEMKNELKQFLKDKLK
jgi:hypothetical protein